MEKNIFDPFKYFKKLSKKERHNVSKKIVYDISQFNIGLSDIVFSPINKFNSNRQFLKYFNWSAFFFIEQIAKCNNESDLISISTKHFYQKSINNTSINNEKFDLYIKSLIKIFKKHNYRHKINSREKSNIIVKKFKDFFYCKKLRVKVDESKKLICEEKNMIRSPLLKNNFDILYLIKKEEFLNLEIIDPNFNVLVYVSDLFKIIGNISSKKELSNKIKNITNHFKNNIYFVLPDFTKRNQLSFINLAETNQLINNPQYLNFYCYIFEVLKQKQLKEKFFFVVPKVRLMEDYNLIKILYNYYYVNDDVQKNKLGLMIETEYPFENPEEFIKTNFGIINTNYLQKDLYYYKETKKLNYETFFNLFSNDLREVHSLMYKRKYKHYVMSNSFSDFKIIEKLMKMGYRNFIVTNETVKMFEKAYIIYMERRGKYKKVKK